MKLSLNITTEIIKMDIRQKDEILYGFLEIQ